jgi:hypothetical protein
LAYFYGTQLLMKSSSDIPEWPGGWSSPPLFSQKWNLITDKEKCCYVPGVYHSKKLNAKNKSHNSSSAFAKSERSDRNWKKEKKQVIYYSDTGDIEGYFPQKYFDYLPKK